jgi:NAD(P)-dependent dehydrogenase (short-subunit alcohol dehydrogenase family)
MERCQGKKVVIVGGTSGMGLATAKLLLDGARVLVTSGSEVIGTEIEVLIRSLVFRPEATTTTFTEKT